MAAVRQSATGQLESWILAQMIEVIAVLIPAANRENPSTNDAAKGMRHSLRGALIRKQPSKPVDDPDTFLR